MRSNLAALALPFECYHSLLGLSCLGGVALMLLPQVVIQPAHLDQAACLVSLHSTWHVCDWRTTNGFWHGSSPAKTRSIGMTYTT